MLVKLPMCDGSVPPGVCFPLAQAAEVALRCHPGATELPGSVPREVLSSCHSILREQLCHREPGHAFSQTSKAVKRDVPGWGLQQKLFKKKKK